MFASDDVELGTPFVKKDAIRIAFTQAMSDLYAREVPLYGDLLALTAKINSTHCARADIIAGGALSPHRLERHGAIRLGTAAELQILRRAFALMGMFPVGYYDLGAAGLPVHSTAFRPIDAESLAACPFRVFTSLLRLDFIEDVATRKRVEALLDGRQIVQISAIGLIRKGERDGGLSAEDAKTFVDTFLQTFIWHGTARVTKAEYEALKAIHPLVADIASFPGPHINHLTPAIVDIDAAQARMHAIGMPAKAVIEGPPRRKCPILLRQTSFKAVSEPVMFSDGEGNHTARFGEIEERGVALTPKGQALYDSLLAETRAEITPRGDGSNASEYVKALSRNFEVFPDDWEMLRAQDLAYFRREPSGMYSPIKYEDFLPISAAGIFQSNLTSDAGIDAMLGGTQVVFENALGCKTANKTTLYKSAVV